MTRINFNEKLLTKCKKATVLDNKKKLCGCDLGHNHVNWGHGNYRVWFVPEAILESWR